MVRGWIAIAEKETKDRGAAGAISICKAGDGGVHICH
jgi:hypothetical protein